MPLLEVAKGEQHRIGSLPEITTMEESTTYQWIMDKGRVEEGKKLLLLQGRIRFGPADVAVTAALEAITDIDYLEELALRLFDVSSWQELLASPPA